MGEVEYKDAAHTKRLLPENDDRPSLKKKVKHRVVSEEIISWKNELKISLVIGYHPWDCGPKARWMDSPYVLIFPFPVQGGHLNAMLKLTQILRVEPPAQIPLPQFF